MSSIALKRARRHAGFSDGATIIVGVLERVSPQGEIFIDYHGNDRGPIQAQVLIAGGVQDRGAWSAGDAVLLLFGPEPPFQPVVLGRVADRLPIPSPSNVTNNPERDITVDGRRVVLDAQEEVILRCGPASITLNSAGKIVIKGAEIVSRSSGANKIKGALVNIN